MSRKKSLREHMLDTKEAKVVMENLRLKFAFNRPATAQGAADSKVSGIASRLTLSPLAY